ncbi:act minimal PKS chain-length factor (CLF/KS beta) [Amycolatopsis echigonensis]|uniref:Act minimal PKS chain-length factor (CLF/KS beta) n=1 Tax=Amycolatopsis echigonensis TaxID=2576905 RepID=A0A2N3WJB8_9PSEU|nr:ketosynthase chain-length factor [Amycolatopsis niigatensis]PKV93959.1 act minimal PKS chain-length factor (CLF/KS beta) [Amycolatopsis niigatensis]
MTAVITGIGIAAPNGIGTETYWEAVLSGTSGLGPITRFDASDYPVKVAGEVAEFCASGYVPGRLAVQTDRWTHLALHAADLALADAQLRPAELPEFEMAVMTASSSGGTEFGQEEIQRLWSRGPEHVTAYQSIAWFYAATTGQLSIRHGMRGACGVICTEQAGGLDAIGRSRSMLDGRTRLVLTGGTDASLCPYGVLAQATNGLLSSSPDPTLAYLPFDVRANGYVPGEGGAILVVEDAVKAAARGAPQGYASVSGYGATFDARRTSRSVAEARAASRLRLAAELAMEDAGTQPAEVDVVFADASGDPVADLVEADAITALFGPYGVPVTAPKIMTGRLNAGGAALDIATAALAMRDSTIPAVTGIKDLAPGCQIDLVTGTSRPGAIRTALVLARGHGGFNAAMVLHAGVEPLERRTDQHVQVHH